MDKMLSEKTINHKNMKKIKTTLLMLSAILLPFMLGSCDCDDDDFYPFEEPDDDYPALVAMAQTLNGKWKGDTYAVGFDENGGKVAQLYYTEIAFHQVKRDAIFGRGMQYDYEGNNQDPSFVRNFTWYIDERTGDIHVLYDGEGGYSDYEMIIDYDDMNLDQRAFTGFLIAKDNSEKDEFSWKRYMNAKKMTVMPVE